MFQNFFFKFQIEFQNLKMIKSNEGENLKEFNEKKTI